MLNRIVFLITLFLISSCNSTHKKQPQVKQKKLQHIVLIKYKENTSLKELKAIEKGAYSLREIAGVKNLNYSENVSPEKLNKGYTHSLTMYFETEKDRDEIYLPHSIHQEFVKLFLPFTTDVLVYDYWE